MVIKPTVGRVVWYFPLGRRHTKGDAPLAAIVTHVWSDTCVNLAIFDANGRTMDNPPTSILLIQEGTTVPDGLYCMWMPYQMGQAAKTEAAEKALTEKTS